MFVSRIVIALCFFSRGDGLSHVPLYANDYSEHCIRRDTLPSVFLGREGMAASSQVLHFSKLDRPYSCIASIRAEPSNNIIMVIQLNASEKELQFCKYGHQLAVYELAETFGGYWGPVPENVLDHDPSKPVYTKQYTLYTDPPPVPSTTTEDVKFLSSVSEPATTIATAETQGFIDIELPLVNISASLIPSEGEDQKSFNMDEYFDLFYDVTPRPGTAYETAMLPLVQIALNKQEVDGDGEPRFELNYQVGQFTPDHRLTISERPKKTNTNRNRNRWKKKRLQEKRVEQKINNSLHTREPPKSRKFFRKLYTLPNANRRSSYKHELPQAITEKKYEDTTEKHKDFNIIDDIMKKLNESGTLKIQEQTTHSDVLAIINVSENNDHNLSIYLAPYPTYTFLPVSDVPINFTKNQTDIPLSGILENMLSMGSQNVDNGINISKLEYSTNKNRPQHTDETLESVNLTKIKEDIKLSAKEIEAASTPVSTLPITDETSTITTLKINASNESLTYVYEIQEEHSTVSVSPTDKGSLSGTLVDHESWENVVQSAPVMAGLLSQHGSELDNSSPFNTSDVPSERKKPRVVHKRNIAAIGVEEALPRRLGSTFVPTSPSTRFGPGDLLEFARLLELPDDEMSNHVIMKLNTKSATKLFDLCQSYNQIQSRFMLLFNSSRILLSIGNFSISHVMVVLTAGRPLTPDESECPHPLVECQVLGTRVCIDSTNACDSIPNCGSLNAYDEDRVLCGLIGQHRSVCLAAATLLAMLATTLYVVYYWLKRCVPNVADAFFVYSDSDENELFLDSIMRSPTDTDNDFRYNTFFFEDEFYSYHRHKSTNILKRVLSILPKLHLFKQRPLSSDLEVQGVKPPLPENSYPEFEIRNFEQAETIDRQVQTGESIEMAFLKMINTFKQGTTDAIPSDMEKRQTSAHDIILQRLRSGHRPSSFDTSSDSPGPSERSVGLTHVGEEKEIHTTLYEPGYSNTLKPGITKASGKRDVAQNRKCLRFIEQATFIPRTDDEEDSVTEEPPAGTRGFPGRTSRRIQQKPGNKAPEGAGPHFRKFFNKKKKNISNKQ